MYRFYEMLPGFLAWGTLVLIIIISWLLPVFAAVFIIVFDVYWLFKTIYLSLHLRATFKKMRDNLKIDWLEKLKIENWKLEIGNWTDIYHLIILPMYKEPYEVVKESFESLAKANYPKDKFIIVLATEERAKETARATAKKIQEEFGARFFKFLITVHPENLASESPGKGSNIAWAAQEAKKTIIDPLKIPYENILVSVFDIDTQVLPDYFANLAYNFLTCEEPQRSSFQPIPLFTNNIFQAPAFARVISFSSTFWHMIQQARPHRLTTFSSQSMPFKPLVEIGFWNTNIVSEDSQIFWQFYLHFDGDWRVVPTNFPVSMDANAAPKFWQTIVNQYKQQRRWAWGGCENIPYLLKGFAKNKKIPFAKKFHWAFNYIEGFHSWATNTIIIFTLGWLPILIGGADFKFSLLSYNLPKITSWIMNLAMLGMVSSAILAVILLPPKPTWFKKRHYLFYLLQWILMPITLIIFGAVPALEAQTRGMLGGKFKLGFWVTPKHR
jgi:cellulose synthase/poly-beta-1,6-N-acetylglucosamine synthase-like glycosyltransferase